MSASRTLKFQYKGTLDLWSTFLYSRSPQEREVDHAANTG
jgi:hypothetical protein